MGNFDAIELGHRVFMFFCIFSSRFVFTSTRMAKWKGDRTADVGRLTLNALAHGDLWGTLILPVMAIVFGFPFLAGQSRFPINSRNSQNPDRDVFWLSRRTAFEHLLAVIAGMKDKRVSIIWPT